MEGAASGRGCRGVRVCGGHWSQPATGRCEVTPCQDRRADAGERFFGSRARQSGFAERKAMIMREHELSITKQAKALRISRGSVYYLPRPVSATDLEIMRLLDRLHLEFPFAGSRMLRGLLATEGWKVGRRHVKTLMKRMGIEALYRRPRTTKPEPGHKIYPYLLRGMEIVGPPQETVEGGWQVCQQLYNDWKAHLFVFYTTNGYSKKGDNIGGYNRDVLGWVQHSRTTFPGALIQPNSVTGGSQRVLFIKYRLWQGNWWFRVGNEWIGFYPASLFSEAGLRDKADAIFFYGEVADSTAHLGKSRTDMGSGRWANEGWP